MTTVQANAHPIIDAQIAVRAYLDPKEGMVRRDAFALAILDRLQTNQNVSAALGRLRSPHTTLIFSYLIEAAEFAKARIGIDRWSKETSEDYRRAAKKAQELLEFCQGKTSIHLWSILPALIEELQEQARVYGAAPREHQINHKSKSPNGEAALALRNFSKRLKENMSWSSNNKLSSPALKKALRWLVEAALGYEIPPDRAIEALRKPRRPRSAAVTAAEIRHSRAGKPKQFPTI
jgi:hypothetical protein